MSSNPSPPLPLPPPSYSQIISDALSFMVGGFHTSGYFMTWLFWYLAKNPAVQEKLVEEVEAEVGGECGEKLKKYALNPNTSVQLLSPYSV